MTLKRCFMNASLITLCLNLDVLGGLLKWRKEILVIYVNLQEFNRANNAEN